MAQPQVIVMSSQVATSRASARDESLPMRPVVLLTPDFATDDAHPTEAEYAIRANYCRAVSDAGGIPLVLPYGKENIAAVLRLCDGVVITGSRPGVNVAPEREDFEIALIEATARASIPLMGICHGMQLIGRTLGGELVPEIAGNQGRRPKHIPFELPTALAHRVSFVKESLLAQLAPTLAAEVNSYHRHQLRGPGRFRVTARSEDDVIEAFEGDTPELSLGIQWHPEYQLSPLDQEILALFVARCNERARTNGRFRAVSPSSVRARLSSQGLVLPEVPQLPSGAFVGATRWGNQVTVSGQVPLKDGEPLALGRLGDSVSIEIGRECARQALLNALAQLDLAAGGLDRVSGFVRLGGYVAATPEFTQHGKVVDAASELLRDVFPDGWHHARVALGMASLPRGVPVEIELTAVVDWEA
jgi:gamma-glutamyl-gamma-aminobutyrate hydrolase PuuD/enamine deaminase RidA (YjgF/YER057c/UK114 family)